ncbi:MAG: hypothetical protein KatS3mg057_2273 [Herpetosiphonaceae bacterium]|nr:MAG: hypothetical protein KatS3mg057_2273 [Herpetosiphonaceae bacterium]
MKTIQVTIDEPLLNEVDRAIQELQTTRSEFIRSALRLALRRYYITHLEQQHAQGYAAQPMTREEIAEWEDAQAWGAE